MPRYTPPALEVHVLTHREGVLAKVGHDLHLRVEDGWLEWTDDATAVRAELVAESLRLVAAVVDGRDVPGALSASDTRDIEKNLRDDVLEVRAHRSISFASTRVTAAGDGYRVDGNLTLHGVTRPLSAEVRREGERLVTEVTLTQPDWGIRPFRAMLGALKIHPDVRVRVSVPAPR